MKFTKDMRVHDLPAKYHGAFNKWKKYHETPIEDIFWKKVNKLEPDKCWEWKGGRTESSYGLFYLRGEKFDQMLSHRMAWIITHGHIPDGLYVLHKCDNPPCCNPNHLFVGTQKDNVSDMIAKGRNNQPKGEHHRSNVLSERQVLEIRKRYHPKKTTLRLLAQEYGVHKSTITAIISRRSWNHIPDSQASKC